MKENIGILIQSAPAFMYIVVFLYGLLIGSFLNVCIYRLPEQQSIVTIPSHCMNCGKKLHWYELIPLFSWLALRGKCHGCKAKISAQYPIVEAMNALLYILVLFIKGPSIDMLLCQALISNLIVLSFIDARTMEIPNGINIFIAVLGVARTLVDWLVYKNGWLDHVLGLIVMVVFFIIFFVSDGRAIGFGDVKMMFGIGLFLGLKCTVFGLAAGCIVGSVIHLTLMAVKKVGRQLAFGPYLSTGFAISALFGKYVVDWYLNTFFSF